MYKVKTSRINRLNITTFVFVFSLITWILSAFLFTNFAIAFQGEELTVIPFEEPYKIGRYLRNEQTGEYVFQYFYGVRYISELIPFYIVSSILLIICLLELSYYLYELFFKKTGSEHYTSSKKLY